jgi:hypothetical protein
MIRVVCGELEKWSGGTGSIPLPGMKRRSLIAGDAKGANNTWTYLNT